MKGRKPKPAAVRKLEGRRIEKHNRPTPQPSMPSCPEFITGEARAEWDRIAPQLYELGLLTKLDMATLAAYCYAYAEWKEASEGVERDGFTIKTNAGNVIQNPYLGIKHTAAAFMLKMAAEFGMTPVSRSRLQIEDNPKDFDPMEELLNRIPRRGNTN